MKSLRMSVMIGGFLLGTVLRCQPGAPALSFTLVHDAKGKPMQGPHAENALMRDSHRQPHKEPWTVEIHYTIPKDDPYTIQQAGKYEQWPLAAAPVRDGRREHL